jgi:cell division septum initiation protein DivIVA
MEDDIDLCDECYRDGERLKDRIRELEEELMAAAEREGKYVADILIMENERDAWREQCQDIMKRANWHPSCWPAIEQGVICRLENGTQS